MSECRFYERREKQMRSRLISADRSPADVIALWMEWCKHERSPVTERQATSVGGSALTCGGERARCTIAGLWDEGSDAK